ncbi:3'-5' exonuclease [Stenotrophomonas maltophilia]|uniref:3'-5' exonuclease n=1 Tax=Stenotrophomonas maltophilia TaxID=40324 RepID=UPI0013D9F332|nr:3'-5' exonuclease [Stenotrophomonas maltophilia]MDZ5789344.1 3'-5' exonuclease [Stenotrophomonas maltophilia]
MFSNWAPYLMRMSLRLSLWATGWQRRFGARLRIEFYTAPSSKGLEAEYVFVLNAVQGTRGFASQIQDDPALQLAMPAPDPFSFAEERRLFYVAMTRSRMQVRFYTLLAQPLPPVSR